jgi:Uma2 family endonuclease
MSVQLRRTRFTADQYEAMGSAGILTEDERVELVEGEIVDMTPIGSRHAACAARIADVLSLHTRQFALVSMQNPVRLDEQNEPQPDVLLLRRRPDYYATQHPGPDDVIALVEVADATLTYDRDVKVPLYARAGVPEVWLVDLQTLTILVWHDPHDGEFRMVRMLRPGDSLTPALLPDVTLSVAELLG